MNKQTMIKMIFMETINTVEGIRKKSDWFKKFTLSDGKRNEYKFRFKDEFWSRVVIITRFRDGKQVSHHTCAMDSFYLGLKYYSRQVQREMFING